MFRDFVTLFGLIQVRLFDDLIADLVLDSKSFIEKAGQQVSRFCSFFLFGMLLPVTLCKSDLG